MGIWWLVLILYFVNNNYMNFVTSIAISYRIWKDGQPKKVENKCVCSILNLFKFNKHGKI